MATSPSAPELDFYYDICCPFAYIASTKIASLEARTHAAVHYRPVLLGGIYRATAAPQGAGGSASDVFNPAKKAVASAAVARTLRRLGIAYRAPPRHPLKTLRALRLLYCVPDGERRRALTAALFRAYWVEGRDVSAGDTLVEIVREAGIDGLVEALRQGSWEGGEQARRELEESTTKVVERGAPGVPAFWLPGQSWVDSEGRERQGRLYWGQDRMHFVEAVLLTLRAGRAPEDMHTLSVPLQDLIPRRVTDLQIPAGQEAKLEFWFDFSSPWAFLGWTQLERLRRRFGTRLHIDMRPFLLGILFREIGAPNTPMMAVSRQKREYSQLDHADWCRWWNAVAAQSGRTEDPIAFRWSPHFPLRTPTCLRALLVEPRLDAPIFRACWERRLDVSSDQVLAAVIRDAGFDAATILARADSAPYRKALRARTAEAKTEGLCGVPSYRVFRRRQGGEWAPAGGLVWGQDELPVVEDMIAGWDDEAAGRIDAEDVKPDRSRL